MASTRTYDDKKFLIIQVGNVRRYWMFPKKDTLGELMRVVTKRLKHDYPQLRKVKDEDFCFLEMSNAGSPSMYLDPEKKVEDLTEQTILVKGKGKRF